MIHGAYNVKYHISYFLAASYSDYGPALSH
jgi:hypothetical protein